MNTHSGKMDDESILERYKLANLSTIVGMDRNVFASLMDVPRLLEERKELASKVERLEHAIRWANVAIGGKESILDYFEKYCEDESMCVSAREAKFDIQTSVKQMNSYLNNKEAKTDA